ncbi:MAG: hypothetical protein F6J86_36430 [Symploca sp. SIO1B1]|nr:hypothetical protein [Symploca sp. SIO1B1]
MNNKIINTTVVEPSGALTGATILAPGAVMFALTGTTSHAGAMRIGLTGTTIYAGAVAIGGAVMHSADDAKSRARNSIQIYSTTREAKTSSVNVVSRIPGQLSK